MAQKTEPRHDADATAHPMVPRPFVIERVRRETRDVFTLELLPSRDDGFTFAPGQFNMLYVFGVGEVPISISGDPAKSPRLQHTTRVVGTVTKAMERLKKGDTVGVRGPFGTSWSVAEEAGRDLLIVAGGIGLAPLRPLVYHALAHRERYRHLVLLYGTRTPDDILYRQELEAWRDKFGMEVRISVDRAPTGWHGHVGVVTTLIARTAVDEANTVAVLCGPEVMMRFAAREIQHRGVAPQRMYLSMERNMKCAIGLCGHCQYGPVFICKDGPVFPFHRLASLWGRPGI